MLRHYVPHFPPSSEGIACWLSELNAALYLDTRVKKWKYKCKKIFLLLEWGSNPQPVGFTVTFCAAAPRLASWLVYKSHIYKIGILAKTLHRTSINLKLISAGSEASFATLRNYFTKWKKLFLENLDARLLQNKSVIGTFVRLSLEKGVFFIFRVPPPLCYPFVKRIYLGIAWIIDLINRLILISILRPFGTHNTSRF